MEEKERSSKTGRKATWWYIALIVIMIILIFIIGRSCCSVTTSHPLADSLAILKNRNDSLKIKADSLRIAYNKCAGILTPAEQIAELQAEVNDLKKRPQPRAKTVYHVIRPRMSRPTPKKTDLVETSFTGFNPAPVAKKETPRENNLVVTQYRGVMKGDYGTTIDDNSGRIVYFIKNNFVHGNGGDEAPRLNGRGGEKFSYNPQTGYWYYVDGQVMTVGEINSWAYAREWNVYIGQTDYGTGSYETYLPHQALKPLINRVRGKEWGEISDEDLIKMRRLNSSIWTPSEEGTLRPFRLSKNGGRAYGKEDHQLYQGWNFRTRIVAIKR